jgi:hypothetical protein
LTRSILAAPVVQRRIPDNVGFSSPAMREETERLVKEALERKTLTVKQGKIRIDSKC